jgi:hypothetical protein
MGYVKPHLRAEDVLIYWTVRSELSLEKLLGKLELHLRVKVYLKILVGG